LNNDHIELQRETKEMPHTEMKQEDMELYKQIWRITRCSTGEKGVELRKKDVRNDVHKSVIN
jgi:hypothetical protein